MNLTQSVRLEPISKFKLQILGKVDCLNIRKIEKFLSNQEDPTNEGKISANTIFSFDEKPV